MVKFSIVIPIKNEIDLLPYTLPSYYELKPYEIIFCVDYPVDPRLKKNIIEISRFYDDIQTRILEVKKNPDFRFHQAWVRRSGFREAKCDIILTADIDTILDSKIRNYLNLINDKVKLITQTGNKLREMMPWIGSNKIVNQDTN